MASMHSRRLVSNLAAFVRLAFEPFPRFSLLVNGVLVLFGISIAGVLTWLRTPAVHHVLVAPHHWIAVPVGTDRVAWAAGAALVVVVLLLLWAGVRLVGEVASRPRLMFAGTDRAYASVTHGPLADSTLEAAATRAASPFSVVGPLPIAGASGAFGIPTGSATVGASGPLGPTGPADTQDACPHHNEYVRVLVKNEPISGFGADAEHVAARIEFFGADDTSLLEMAGRWAEADQRLETKRLGITHEAEELTIGANGVRHELDIALKAPGDKHFYACNDDNASGRDHRLVQCS